MITMSFTRNIAFAGLTAAGKTTHARLLASELGYEYVSATDILLEMLGVDTPGDQVWFARLQEINEARGDGAVDAELEQRLLELNRTRHATVFDTWALAWIGDEPLVRIWLESDADSRARKCLVSQRQQRLGLDECRNLIDDKDTFNRELFTQRHGFDLFTDRDRYDVILCNSHLIPQATDTAAQAGIEAFAPIVHAAVTSVLTSDTTSARELARAHPREVHRITVPDTSTVGRC
ncbi:cytidylate kinase family protein [Saccharopolyspora elongata]|nr:cytidylate kinase family protein [Saccharopolyspora elongata]